MKKLIVAYSLSTWNVRTEEWTTALFLTFLYKNTLLQISILQLVATLSAILSGRFIGLIIDKSHRFKLLSSLLFIQKIAIVFISVLLWSINDFQFNIIIEERSLNWNFALLVITAALLKITNQATQISVERDWAAKIAESVQSLARLNSKLKFVDLFAKLVAPLFVSFLLLFFTIQITLLTITVISTLSIVIEYWCIRKTFYENLNSLSRDTLNQAVQTTTQNQSETLNQAFQRDTQNDSQNQGQTDIIQLEERQCSTFTPAENIGPVGRQKSIDFSDIPFTEPAIQNINQTQTSIKSLIKRPEFLTSIAISLLYFNVLSFGSVMIAYLLNKDLSPLTIAIFRGFSVIIGLFSTISFPAFTIQLGATRFGLWSIWLEFFFISLAVFSLFIDAAYSLYILLIAVAFSRFGLWSFDLCQTQILQIYSAEVIGSITGIQISMQNLFDGLMYLSTIYWSSNDQFWIPSLISLVFLAMACVVYTLFSIHDRGHLIHWEKLSNRHTD